MNMLRWSIAAALHRLRLWGGGNEPPPFKPIADTALLMEAFIDPMPPT